MIKVILLLISALLISAESSSQLKEVINKAKNKINQRTDQKIDNAMDKTLDKVEGKESKPLEKTSEADDKKSEVEEVSNTGISSYKKFDFIPGEEVIYSNSFEGENQGELPTGWNSSGNGVILTLDKIPGNWLQPHHSSVALSDNTNLFTENFTLEFDLILQHKFNGGILPVFTFGVLSSGDKSTTDNELLKNYNQYFATELHVQPGVHKDSHLHLETVLNGKRYLNTEKNLFKNLETLYNKVIHISMQVQKERLRIWVNDEKLYDLPKAIPPAILLNQFYFRVHSSNYSNDEVSYCFGNIKIAKGIPDTRHKLIEEGKFSTTGILFDVNSSVIKPESNGVLKEIADLLKKHPEINVKIIGHTDSDGTDASNMDLSKKRAAAVKEILSNSFSIEASRMDSDGKGEFEPAADNKTREGKAQNRRVEFIRQ